MSLVILVCQKNICKGVNTFSRLFQGRATTFLCRGKGGGVKKNGGREAKLAGGLLNCQCNLPKLYVQNVVGI